MSLYLCGRWYIRAVSSYSLWYHVSEVKVYLFHIWICWNVQIFNINDASFSCKILLKLIHFKSLNSGVTWFRFKYFPLQLLEQSWYIFVLHTAVFHCIYPILNDCRQRGVIWVTYRCYNSNPAVLSQEHQSSEGQLLHHVHGLGRQPTDRNQRLLRSQRPQLHDGSWS